MNSINENFRFYNQLNIGNTKIEPKKILEQNQNPPRKQKSDSFQNMDSDALLRSLDALSSYSKVKINDFTNSNLKSSSNNCRNYTLSTEALKAGSRYLADEGTPEYQALYDLMEENFICIPDKESAMEIMQRQYNSMNITSNDNVYVLDPADQNIRTAKHIGTSNAYMSQWYKDINNIENDVITRDNIQSVIDKSESDEVIIIVPDDCAITGRSMIMDTINTLNTVDIPKEKKIKLILSPMISTEVSDKALNALSQYDMESLKNTQIFNGNGNDFESIDKFFTKSAQIEVQTPTEKIEAKPFYKSEYFKNLQENNPEVASKVQDIITCKGTAKGFGRPGISGVMIATPKEVVDKNGNISYPLKCPNNNVYGAAPYALAQGALPTTVKQPSKNIGGEKCSPAKWQFLLKGMYQDISKLMKQE